MGSMHIHHYHHQEKSSVRHSPLSVSPVIRIYMQIGLKFPCCIYDVYLGVIHANTRISHSQKNSIVFLTGSLRLKVLSYSVELRFNWKTKYRCDVKLCFRTPVLIRPTSLTSATSLRTKHSWQFLTTSLATNKLDSIFLWARNRM